MALTSNFAALPAIKVFGFPVLAALAAGTGTLVAHVIEPALAARQSAEVVAVVPIAARPAAGHASSAARPAAKRPCESQSWPYIDNRCLANATDRNVRLVMAPHDDDGISALPSAGSLVSSDGVLRGPGVATEAQKPVTKKEPKRSEARRRHEASRATYTRFGQQRIVVHPLRTNYSSRF
jgi:hypothetical protein